MSGLEWTRASVRRHKNTGISAGGWQENTYHIYETDGRIAGEQALHPVAVTATVAMSVLAADTPYSKEWVERFWNLPMRTGGRRYYDNCLYFFAFLALSGNYRIW